MLTWVKNLTLYSNIYLSIYLEMQLHFYLIKDFGTFTTTVCMQ